MTSNLLTGRSAPLEARPDLRDARRAEVLSDTLWPEGKQRADGRNWRDQPGARDGG